MNKIQQILASAKAKFISKYMIDITGDITIMLKDYSRRTKATIKDKCFNYHKINYFTRDYIIPNS